MRDKSHVQEVASSTNTFMWVQTFVIATVNCQSQLLYTIIPNRHIIEKKIIANYIYIIKKAKIFCFYKDTGIFLYPTIINLSTNFINFKCN